MTKRAPKKRNTPAIQTISDLCTSRGISKQVLITAIETGRISSDHFPARGRRRSLGDPAKAGEALDQYLATRKPQSIGSAGDLSGVDMEDPTTWPQDLDGLRIVREWWTARHAKRKDDIAAGELLRADEVRRHLFASDRILRDRLLKFPDGAAADLAAAFGDAGIEVVRERLRSFIERGLADLAVALRELTTPPKDIDSV